MSTQPPAPDHRVTCPHCGSIQIALYLDEDDVWRLPFHEAPFRHTCPLSLAAVDVTFADNGNIRKWELSK